MQTPPSLASVAYKDIFSTPLITGQLADSDNLVQQLRSVVQAKQAQQKSVSRSNVGGWQSDTNMLQWGGEPARMLGIQILQILGNYTRDIGQTDPNTPRFEWSAEMWANANGKGGSHESHTHPGSLWSAVCFINTGLAENENEGDAGKLVLQDPRHPMPVMYKPDIRFTNDKYEHYMPDMRITPQVGKVVIFPSWLSHYVTAHNGSEERVSIAINYFTLPARDQS